MRKLSRLAAIALLISYIGLNVLGELSHRLFHYLDQGKHIASLVNLEEALRTDVHAGAAGHQLGYAKVSIPCPIAQVLVWNASLMVHLLVVAFLLFVLQASRYVAVAPRQARLSLRPGWLPWHCGPPFSPSL